MAASVQVRWFGNWETTMTTTTTADATPVVDTADRVRLSALITTLP